MIKTKAIQELAALRFNFFSADFVNIAIAILCQHHGYIPQYITPESFLVNNYFGYETYTNWIPKVVDVKKEYYRQTMNYRKETIQYYEKDNQALRVENQALEGERSALEEANQALGIRCEALSQNVEAVSNSLSWKITAPLRCINNIFRKG